MRDGRWILARTTKRAHLDLGERSSKSLRVQSEHIIVTACRAHVNANAEIAPATHEILCSNCMRIWRNVNRKRLEKVARITSLWALSFFGGWLEQVCPG